MRKIIGRVLPLLLLLLGLLLFLYFELARYLSFDYLQEHRVILLAWIHTHYLFAVLSFVGIYILAVAISVPGALFLTVTGGFFFGPFWGALYVVLAATTGATILFFAVHLAFNSWLSQKTAVWMVAMREGFRRHAFSYLLILRLIPMVPFWVVNIVPGLLNVKPRVFIIATLIGIIPGSLIYAMVGNGLGHVFNRGEKPNLSIVLTPEIFLPLLGLALLSMAPLVFQRIRKNRGL